MTLQIDTLIAVSLMMAVFSAVAAVGTSIVLGVGFERLRAGFEIISKQTGFFSDVINKLEKKVEKVDESTDDFSRSISTLEAKVGSVGEQANLFTQSMQKLERKVEIVDKQTGYFSDALYRLEQQVEAIETSPPAPVEEPAELISTGKAEALVAHAEDLLSLDTHFTQYLYHAGSNQGGSQDKEETRYH